MMYNKELFKDNVALITGGRSGIGYGIARQFLELGGKVFICSRKEEKLKAAAETLKAFGPVAYQPCDIRQSDQLEAVADQIKEIYGRLDVLVNNAGGQFPCLSEYINDKGWNAVINNNLNGTFYASRVMANRFFIPQKEGNIVNIIVVANRGFPGMAHTSAARAGVENLTKSLAQEWAKYHIRVNAIAPGIIESSGLESYAPTIRELTEDYKKDNLMKRLGTVEDVANAVSFLASPLSSYTSGITLYVDGMDHLHGDRMAMIRKVIGE
jgi:citronellol/citronellal dehydrogenase